MAKTHKVKIINDSVHGFITISSPVIYSLLEHPYFQRLRNIKQLGLTNLVYPGACHNRFQHALGAMHLMDKALATLKNKGHEITPEETEAALTAMLLHDIGHGPFSHALESAIVDFDHETVSMFFLEYLNREFDLNLSMEILSKKYKKQFLNELVSGQLDMDRLDYLRRDSFFSGVVEGMVGLDRIISMLDIADGKLVVEAKGIYSIEKFIISRRLMYWQVYLHKTVLSAETVLGKIFERAKYLSRNGEKLFASPALDFFLNNSIDARAFAGNAEAIGYFAQLSDGDIESAANVWISHRDRVLSELCRMLTYRNLPRTAISSAPFSEEIIERKKSAVKKSMNLTSEEADWFVISKMISNKGYSTDNQAILIKYSNGVLMDIYEASDIFRCSNINEETHKYMLCAPKLDE